MATITQYPLARSLTADLAYSILLALGGTMAEVKGIYDSNTDDLLYAVLERIQNGGTGRVIDATGLTTIELASGTIIHAIVAVSDVPGTNFKAGTANGLDDIVENTVLEGSSLNDHVDAFPVSYFAKNTTTVFFTYNNPLEKLLIFTQ